MTTTPCDHDTSAGSTDTLAWSLRYLLTQAGREPDRDAVHLALGPPLWICASTRRPPAGWLDLAADLNLLPVARLFGIRLRDLHPRPAATDLDAAPEYLDHFVDSYLPLIHRSLSHGEHVIARGGWQAPHAGDWGVITGEDGEGLGVRGHVRGETRTVPLDAAAVQCYVVEKVSPIEPAAKQVAAAALDALVRLDHEASEDPDLRTGAGAWALWIDHVRQDAAGGIEDHQTFARGLLANRRVALAFFTNWPRQSATNPKTASAGQGIAESLSQVIDALIETIEPTRAQPSALAGALERAAAADAVVLENLQTLVPAKAT